MKTFRIAVLPGDGIGPEVIAEGVAVLRAVEAGLDGVEFETNEFAAGAGEYLHSGDPFPEETFEQCKQHDAILLGAMGLPDVRLPSGTEVAPQLDLRERLDLYCGLRPIRLYHADHSPLKGYAAGDIDFAIVRENTEGLFSTRGGSFEPGAEAVEDTLRISRHGAERVLRSAFKEASRRGSGRRGGVQRGGTRGGGKVTLVDKSNVLPSMAFFRGIFEQIRTEFPAIEAEAIYVDAAALYLVKRPGDFDVIVTENLFGDILSDLAAGLVGGMGMAPSGDIGERYAVFQPSHGSAPDIAGKGLANPVATILSVAMMLEWLDHPETQRGASAVRRAVSETLSDSKNRTSDLGGTLTTTEMGAAIREALRL